jgi:carbon dioxide concentrating mechanism protein CcmO
MCTFLPTKRLARGYALLAERIGELNAVMVIPRPLDDLEQTLPTASCWLDQPEPLVIPLNMKTREKELVELPNLQEVPLSSEQINS